MEKVAVIIPFYKTTLNQYEQISLQQCIKVLSGHPIIAIKPAGLTLPVEVQSISFSEIITFDGSFFKDIAGYNKLMLSVEFYGRFLNYEYILIYQLDTFVFKDELLYWCNQGYDYIGAPWIKKTYHKNAVELFLMKTGQFFSRMFRLAEKTASIKYQLQNKVGNGGFSLRKVSKFNDLCMAMRYVIDDYLAHTDHYHNEDVFWSIEVNRQKQQLHIPDCKTALKFAFEVPPVKLTQFNEQTMPFGCHDWDKYHDFWRPIFKRYHYHI